MTKKETEQCIDYLFTLNIYFEFWFYLKEFTLEAPCIEMYEDMF